MSIFKTMYKNTGGTLPGMSAQDAYDRAVASGSINVPQFTGDPATDSRLLQEWYADTNNWKQYYPDSAVAEFDRQQILGQEAQLGAAQQYDDITQDLIGQYQDQLDPNSDFNRRAAQAAQAAVASTASGQGILGGIRSNLARQGASRQAIDANTSAARTNLANIRESLTRPGEILENVGATRRERAQDVLNEDVDRHNYHQNIVQNQVEQAAGLAAQTNAANQNMGGIVKMMNIGGQVPGETPMNSPLEAPQMPASDPMMSPGISGDPMMNQPAPAPVMDSGMPMDSGMNPLESPDMMGEFDLEPMSELDKIEDSVEQLIASTGLPLTVTRKMIKGKVKKKGS